MILYHQTEVILQKEAQGHLFQLSKHFLNLLIVDFFIKFPNVPLVCDLCDFNLSLFFPFLSTLLAGNQLPKKQRFCSGATGVSGVVVRVLGVVPTALSPGARACDQ